MSQYNNNSLGDLEMTVITQDDHRQLTKQGMDLS